MAKSEAGSSTNTGAEKGKYNKLSQKKYEDMMDRSMKKVVSDTDKMAARRYAGGIEGDGSNPPMAPSIPGESKAKKGEQVQEKTKKGAKK